jgi:hypothetical protein
MKRPYNMEDMSRGSSRAYQLKTRALGDVAPTQDFSSLPISSTPGTFYMMDYAMDLLSPSAVWAPATPGTNVTTQNALGLGSPWLWGLGLLALVMMSGGHR